MRLYLLHTIFLFAYCINESKSQKWVDPRDLTPKYPTEWVDPHDMRPSKEYLKYTNNPSSLHQQKHAAASDQLTEMYYKRTINMLLKSVHEDNNEIDVYSGYLYFKINSMDYVRLKSFAENTENELNLFEINKILEEILTKPSHQHIQEYLETWFHKFLNVTFSRTGIFTIIFLSYFVVVYEMIRAKYNLQYIFTFFLINIFIYDFIFTWIHLYQKTEIENMVKRMQYDDVPVACNANNMDSWQFLWKLFKVEDECQKFHQVTYQDIFWKVSPGAVLTDMFGRTIEQPATSIGNAFANICGSIYDKFPWPFNIIIFPFAMVFFCLLTMITLSVLFNRNLYFNFLHLFSFSNSAANNAKETSTNDRLTDQNVERLLRIAETQQQQIQQHQQQQQQIQQHQQQQIQNRVFIEEIPLIIENTIKEEPIKKVIKQKSDDEEGDEPITSTITNEGNNQQSTNQSHLNINNDINDIGAGDS